MNTRNKNGRIQAAFSILDTALCGFSSATSHSRSSCSLGEKLTRWVNTVQRFSCDVLGGGSAKVVPSRRRPGPTPTGKNWRRLVGGDGHRALSIDNAVWVPAFAGTTMDYAVCATAARDFGALVIADSAAD